MVFSSHSVSGLAKRVDTLRFSIIWYNWIAVITAEKNVRSSGNSLCDVTSDGEVSVGPRCFIFREIQSLQCWVWQRK